MLTADNIDEAYDDYMASLFVKYQTTSSYALEMMAFQLAEEGKDVESDEIFYILQHR